MPLDPHWRAPDEPEWDPDSSEQGRPDRFEKWNAPDARGARRRVVPGEEQRVRAALLALGAHPVAAPPEPSRSGHARPAPSTIALDFTRIAACRHEAGRRRGRALTQAELARLAGVDVRTIRRAESGRHWPSVETVQRIADALGIPREQMQALWLRVR